MTPITTDSYPNETVLIDGDDFYAVLAAVRGLRRAGFRPWLLDPGGLSYARHSRVLEGRTRVPEPLVAPVEFVEAAAVAATHTGATIVMPGTEAALVALSGSAGRFTAGVSVGAPPVEVVARATAKSGLAELAPQAGLATPETIIVTRDEFSAALPFPVMVKPLRTKSAGVDGTLAHGKVRVAHNLDELRIAAAQLPGDEVVVQRKLDGSLIAVSGVAWEGRVVCFVHQRALRVSPPQAGISSLAETIAPNPELEGSVARLIELIGWSGIFQLQLLATADGSYAIDLNPRIYGSIALAIAAGANLPAIWAHLLAGREPETVPYRIGTRYRSEEKEAQAFALALRRGDLHTAIDCLRPHRGTTHAAFAFGDPLPLLASIRKAVAALA